MSFHTIRQYALAAFLTISTLGFVGTADAAEPLGICQATIFSPGGVPYTDWVEADVTKEGCEVRLYNKLTKLYPHFRIEIHWTEVLYR